MGKNYCFGCGKSGHRLINCPPRLDKVNDGRKVPPNGSESSALKKNRFFDL